MERTRIFLALGLALAGVTACGDEDPSAIGGGVVDPAFRTYEVVLEPEEFLVADTSYDNLGSIRTAPFALVAESFEAELSAHTLFRIQQPASVEYADSSGDETNTGDFSIVGGTLTLVVDSLARGDEPVQLELYPVTEDWSRFTVTWELRADTSGVQVPWSEPGGTVGERLSVATWEEGTDTVRLELDSATVALWTDSVAAFRGGLVRSATPDTRLRIQSMAWAFDARPDPAPDTVVEGGSLTTQTFLVTPEPPEGDRRELRVGGVPIWRSALQFRPAAEIHVPCAAAGLGCTLPLDETTVNLGTLLLTPMATGSRRVERPYRVEARGVLRAPGVPVSRSPLTPAFAAMAEAIPPELFEPGYGGGELARVPITGFIRQLIDAREDGSAFHWIALLTENETSNPVFGFGTYGSLQSTVPPRLQLVVTVPIQEN